MRSIVALVLVAVCLASCGVPADDAPRFIDEEAVPFDLLEPGTDRPPMTQVPPPQSQRINIYLVADDTIAPVERAVTDGSDLQARLAALQAGPTDEELASGLQSAIDRTTGSLTGVRDGALVTVRLPETFAAIEGPDHVLAIGQVVYTVTELDGVDGVVFELSGERVEVPTADGTLTRGPVGRDAFGTLRRPD